MIGTFACDFNVLHLFTVIFENSTDISERRRVGAMLSEDSCCLRDSRRRYSDVLINDWEIATRSLYSFNWFADVCVSRFFMYASTNSILRSNLAIYSDNFPFACDFVAAIISLYVYMWRLIIEGLISAYALIRSRLCAPNYNVPKRKNDICSSCGWQWFSM